MNSTVIKEVEGQEDIDAFADLFPPEKKKFNVKSLAKWHEQLVDWMLLNPDKTMVDAATFFDCTPEYLRLLTKSDTFVAYWKERRGDLAAKIDQGIMTKLQNIADSALDITQHRLDKDRDTISLSQAQEVATKALTGLGYYQKGPSVSVAVNQTNTFISSAPADVLVAARERAKQIQGITNAPVQSS